MNIEKFFTDDKYLPSFLSGYRLRQNQVEVAKLISRSMESYQNAIIEAPTGSGKTMAYLIPVIDSGRKVIISTKTKQLMNQIFIKDIPTVKKFLGQSSKITILKGRKNYFCPNRFFRLVMPNTTFYPEAINWYENELKNGISEAPWGKLDNDVCNLMTADKFQCKSSKCPDVENCPFYYQKDIANTSDVIITNHFLISSDMSLKSESSYGIFSFKDHIIFDEAHSLPDIYAQYAGVEISLFSVTLFFRENKDIFTLGEIDKILASYFEINNKITESKVLYKKYSVNVNAFVDLCKSIVESKNNDDILDEFNRYFLSFNVFNDNSEGVRIIEKNEHRLLIKFIPLNASDSFSSNLKEMALSSVFISATISANGNFKYFLSETGLKEENTIFEALPSSFNFKKQAKLYVPTEKECYNKDNIYEYIVNNIQGSILVICNSLERMRQVGETIQKLKTKKQVIFQTSLDFKNIDNLKNVVLVGCASLREGIDLSGAGFRCVILDKLPFEYFKDYFLESKAEKIKREKGDSFMNFYLPRAVLYFKQAVGRLIRHEDDYGLWVVLDTRIISKNYGKYFLNVLENVDIVNNKNIALNFVNGGANE